MGIANPVRVCNRCFINMHPIAHEITNETPRPQIVTSKSLLEEKAEGMQLRADMINELERTVRIMRNRTRICLIMQKNFKHILIRWKTE